MSEKRKHGPRARSKAATRDPAAPGLRTPRRLEAVPATSSPDYPDLIAVRSWLRRSARLAVGGGVAALGLMASGCEPPTCQSSRVGELAVHGEQSVDSLADFELRGAVRQMGVGFGFVDHYSGGGPMVAGEMVPVMPPGPGPDPDASDGEGFGGGDPMAPVGDPKSGNGTL